MRTDLSDLDLRGHSFVGAHLPLTSLARADLRGADFTRADLRGADLTGVRSGMSRGWTALVVLASLALSIGIGAMSGIAGNLLHQLIASDDGRRRAIGVVVAIALLAYLVVGMWRGLRFATVTVLPVVAGLAVVVAMAVIVRGVGTGVGALAIIAFMLLAAAIVVLSVLARAVAGTTSAVFFVIVAMSGALTGRALGGGLTALAVAVGAMVMARRSAKEQDDFPLMTRISTAIACRGGTRFRSSSLTGAHFEGASLVACDFRGAELAGAGFAGARVRLCRFDERVRPPGSGGGRPARSAWRRPERHPGDAPPPPADATSRAR